MHTCTRMTDTFAIVGATFRGGPFLAPHSPLCTRRISPVPRAHQLLILRQAESSAVDLISGMSVSKAINVVVWACVWVVLALLRVQADVQILILLFVPPQWLYARGADVQMDIISPS